jgi:F-type H+-transporting ATPase subunit b
VINLNFTLLIQLINFLALLFILNAILYKPIISKMREREAKIRQDQEKALALEQEVLAQENLHKEELQKARKTAADEKTSLLTQAKQTESEILDKARAEAAKIVEEMQLSIRGDAAEVRKTLRAQMTPLAESMAAKILGRSVA